MYQFNCPYIHDTVDLTQERIRHIVERHPDVLPRHVPDLRTTLARPDAIFRGARTASTRLFWRWIATRQRYLAVVVVLPPPFASQPWIVTAYFAPSFKQYAPQWIRASAKLTASRYC